ncbi:hypothetical protein BGZ54_008087 [Gamsiella multidivaricata]|nr:hypothetical protein BGZ54_008087 [Gamsiella multidivaricata]
MNEEEEDGEEEAIFEDDVLVGATGEDMERVPLPDHDDDDDIEPNTAGAEAEAEAEASASASAPGNTSDADDDIVCDLEEKICMTLTTKRRLIQSKSTVVQYDRCKAHWMKWCDRLYQGNYNVEHKKFLRYMSMNTTEHTDDETRIQPIRVRKKGEASKGRLPSKSTMDTYIKAAMDLYNEQVKDPTNHPTSELVPSLRSKQLTVIMDEHYVRLGKQNSEDDIPQLTLEEGHDLQTLKESMKGGWMYNYKYPGCGRRERKGQRNRLSFV